jgi:hypothetical protein
MMNLTQSRSFGSAPLRVGTAMKFRTIAADNLIAVFAPNGTNSTLFSSP